MQRGEAHTHRAVAQLAVDLVQRIGAHEEEPGRSLDPVDAVADRFPPGLLAAARARHHATAFGALLVGAIVTVAPPAVYSPMSAAMRRDASRSMAAPRARSISGTSASVSCDACPPLIRERSP